MLLHLIDQYSFNVVSKRDKSTKNIDVKFYLNKNSCFTSLVNSTDVKFGVYTYPGMLYLKNKLENSSFFAAKL